MKIAVIGLGQFGFQLALALAEDRHEVVAIDKDEKPVDALKNKVANAVIADAQDSNVLDQLGIQELDQVCVAIGEDFAASLVITANLQELGIKNIFCRSINDVHEKLLKLMRVKNIIQAEALAARELAKRMGIPGASSHFGLSENYGIVELPVPDFLVGRQLLEADLRRRFTVNLVTLRRKGSDGCKIVGVTPPELVFEHGDELVIFGTEEAISDFSTRKRF